MLAAATRQVKDRGTPFLESAMKKNETSPTAPPRGADPAQDLLRTGRRPLDAIFAPKAVAVIGATERPGAVGRDIFANLTNGSFQGKVYAVNSKSKTILGHPAYAAIGQVPDQVELAVIVTPAATVPGLVKECSAAGVKGLIIISAGFKEVGPAGAELERQVMEAAAATRMRIIGPNCLGVMVPPMGMNASFANQMAMRGNVAFISQSGAMGTAILDWSLKERVGFSSFVSIGSMLDVGWGDLIDYYGDDPHTSAIVIYMETVGDARSFLSAAREVALNKPIIVIKAGRTEAAAKAAASHTGSLTGSDAVLDAAFERCGVLRVNAIEDLFGLVEVLSKQPRPRGPRLSIISNAGGPGVLTTDALITDGGQLAEVKGPALQKLNEFLPAAWSHGNPIDLLGDAGADRFARTMEVVAKDPDNDGILVLLTLQSVTQPTETAAALKPYARLEGKPVMACWMGGASVEEGRKLLSEAGIPVFEYPDTAARVFNYLWKYNRDLKSLYETPVLDEGSEDEAGGRQKVAALLKQVRDSGRTILTEFESKEVLEAYRIPIVPTRIARSAGEARQLAESMGYPVVLKLFSETITHKSDVGGVILNLTNRDAVAGAFEQIRENVSSKAGPQHFQGVTVQPMVRLEGYEIILGSSLDPQFGPVLLFGQGGQLVEVMKDSALGLPPLNTNLARLMLEKTKIYRALKGVRGRKTVNLALLGQIMVRFSQLAVEHPCIKEMDINPLIASPERILALDARVVIQGKEVPEEKLPSPAIRPYPSQYVSTWKSKSGISVTLRPIRPEDEPLMVKFHEALSERSVYQRYFQVLKLSQRITHERLLRICMNDFDRKIAMVAEFLNPETRQHQVVAVGRLTKALATGEAEFALVVCDAWQGQGVGTQMLKVLTEIGRSEKVGRVAASIFQDNHVMQRVCQKLGYKIGPEEDRGLVRAEMVL